MNKIILIGRLTRDPEIRYTSSDKPMAIARYSLAVDKKQKREDGITADFFNIVAFDRFADFAERYLRKGIKIAVSGHVQTGTYKNSEGVKIPFFEVVAEEQEFAEGRNASEAEELPFN
jgi:single-strand DNA-binding protein